MKQFIKARRLFEEPEETRTFMTTHEATEYVKNNSIDRKEFKPSVYYSREGDFLCCIWEDVPHYVESIGKPDDLPRMIELCKSNDDNHVVGIQMWRVKERMGLIEIEPKRPYMKPVEDGYETQV